MALWLFCTTCLLTLLLDECWVNRQAAAASACWTCSSNPQGLPSQEAKLVWWRSTPLTADLSLPWLSLLTLSAAPRARSDIATKPLCRSHLCVCVCVFEFHVLVKFSFWQQIEQHQVTHNCSLEKKKKKNAQRLDCSADDASSLMFTCHIPLQKFPLRSQWLSVLGLYQTF